MKNLLKKISALLVVAALFSPSQAGAAQLVFGAVSSDRVDHGSGTAVDGISAAVTVLAWVYPTTITTNRGIVNLPDDAGTSTSFRFQFSGTGGNIRFRVAANDASTSDNISTSTPSAINRWEYWAATWDGATSPEGHIYHGLTTRPAAEVTYSAQPDSTGTTLSAHGTKNLLAGNALQTNNAAFQGRIAYFATYDRALTLNEIRAQQFHPHKVSGCVVASWYGFNGAGTQKDYCGNGAAGTITGATLGLTNAPAIKPRY